MLCRLQHPNIVKFLGVSHSPLCFLLELAPRGSLYDVLEKERRASHTSSSGGGGGGGGYVGAVLGRTLTHKIAYQVNVFSVYAYVFVYPSPFPPFFYSCLVFVYQDVPPSFLFLLFCEKTYS